MIRVDWRVSCRLVGTVLKWLWVPLALPLGIALLDGSALLPFVAPIAGTVALGVGLER
jgi:trk system potassium uptake protein TrkH